MPGRFVLRCAMPASRLFANCLLSLSLAFMGSAEGVTEKLAIVGATVISMRQPRNDGSIVAQVNETWSSITGEELGRRMVAALDRVMQDRDECRCS